LKTLDESTKVIRQNAMAPERAPSVSGIGTVGELDGRQSKNVAEPVVVEKPDYSEAKIVVAMVSWRNLVCRTF
jgi:6-phosphofructo-2-kinase/fructose-2,6-biphosphatase 2